jgi:hypothetical protein
VPAQAEHDQGQAGQSDYRAGYRPGGGTGHEAAADDAGALEREDDSGQGDERSRADEQDPRYQDRTRAAAVTILLLMAIPCLPMRQCSGKRAIGAVIRRSPPAGPNVRSRPAGLNYPDGPWPLPFRWVIMGMAVHVIRGRLGVSMTHVERVQAQTAEAVAGPPRPQVVPLRGLPVVAAVVVFVIASIAGNWLWALTFCHVVGGALWTAIDLFVGLIVGPILGRLSIAARAEFSARFMPKMVLLMPTLVLMTLAAGFQLALKEGNLAPGNPNHAWLIASYCVVGVMAVIALGVLEPANIAVLVEMRKQQPDGAVIALLMRRFIYTAGITGLMQVATLIIMTRVATQ